MPIIPESGGPKKPKAASKPRVSPRTRSKTSSKTTKPRSKSASKTTKPPSTKSKGRANLRTEPPREPRQPAESKPTPAPTSPASKSLSKKRSSSKTRSRRDSSGITGLQAETAAVLTGPPAETPSTGSSPFWQANTDAGSTEAEAPTLVTFRSPGAIDEASDDTSSSEPEVLGADRHLLGLAEDVEAGQTASPDVEPSSLAADSAEVETVDGVEYTSTSRPLPNGTAIETTTYEIDGVAYTQTTTDIEGVATEVLEADRDGVVETTRTRVESVDEDLESLAEGFDDHRVIPGDRGPTQVIEVTVTVVDNNEESPEEVLISDSTVYQQRVPIEEPFDQLRPQGIEVLDGPNGREQIYTNYNNNDDFVHDPDQSHQTITFTESEVLGPDGERQQRTEQTTDFQLVGTGGDGQEASFGHTLTWQSVDGERVGGHAVSETRGIDTVAEFRDSPGVYADDPEFLDRLGEDDEYVNSRTTLTLPPVPGVGPGERSIEYGDYDAEGDGQTLIYRDNTSANGPVPSLTYNSVSNDGQTVDSQTVYYGTEISVRAHTQSNPDGTFVSETTTTDGGEVVSSQTTERTLVTPEELSEDLAPEVREEFLDDYSGGPIFEDSSVLDNGESRSEVTSYSADSADSTITHLTDSDGADVSLLDNPVDGVASMTTSDGDTIRIEGDEVTGTIDGQEIVDLVTEDGESLLRPPRPGEVKEVRSQASAFNRLNKALNIFDKELRIRTTGSRALPIPERFGRGLNSAGVAFGAIGLADSIRNGDAVGAARSVAGATTSFSSFLKDIGRAGPRPPNASATFTTVAQNKVLRGGAYLSAGLAVYDLTQGDYESAAIGGLNALGLALIAAPEPWTSAAGLVIVSGTTIYSIYDTLSSNEGLGDHVDFEF